MKTKTFILSAMMLFIMGCVHLPTVSNFTPPAVTPPAVESQGGLSPAATAALPANPWNQTRIPSGPSASTQAIQRQVNWEAALFVLGGVALLVLAGFLAYAGQIVPAIKIGVAGLLLPIFGIWFAYHWILLIIVILLGSAAFFVATHFAIVKPLLTKLDGLAVSAERTILSDAKKV